MAKTGDELLSALRDTNVDFSQLAKLLNITPENRGTFWKNLIELLKSRDNPLDGNSGDSEALIDNENSVFNFINYYCDLADKTTEEGEVYLSYIFDALKQIYIDANGEPTESKSFWNYSVQEMVDHYMEYFCAETDQDTPLIGGVDYTRRHIKNANAGLSFKDTNWVEPNFNVNDKTYDQVRGHDEVNDILANAHKMQFTHTRLQEDIEGKGAYISDELTDSTYAAPSEKNANDEALNKWIRLLMPQYGRRVEIEDLDRNFWVIAQVIAALSGFLFDDDSPIAEMFKHLLNEIIQLWENVMYLWAEAAITSQKICTNVRVITLPVPEGQEFYNEDGDWEGTVWSNGKFDNFSLEYTENADKEKENWGYDLRFVRARSNENEQNNPYYIIADRNSIESDYYKQALNQTEIRGRIKFLVDKYSDDNLIIIPFERLRNYKHNWYGCQNYRYVYTYHRGKNTWKTYRIRTYLQSTTVDNKNIYYYTYANNGDLSKLEEITSDTYESTWQDIISGFPVTLAPIKYLNNESDQNWILNHFSDDLYHADKIYGIRKDEDNYNYECMSPFHLNESENIDEDTRYYGNLRVEVNVNYDLNLESLDLTSITFDVYDAAAPMIRGTENKIATYEAAVPSSVSSNGLSEGGRKGKIGYEENETGASPKIWLEKTYTADDRSESHSSISYETLANRKSLYMGETVSYYNDCTLVVQPNQRTLATVVGVICGPPDTNSSPSQSSQVDRDIISKTSVLAGIETAINDIQLDEDVDSNIIIGFGVTNNNHSNSGSLLGGNYNYYDKDSGNLSSVDSPRYSTYSGSMDGGCCVYFFDKENSANNSSLSYFEDDSKIWMYGIYTYYNQKTQYFIYAESKDSFKDKNFYIQINNLVYDNSSEGSANVRARIYPLCYQITNGEEISKLTKSELDGKNLTKISSGKDWLSNSKWTLNGSGDSNNNKAEYYEKTINPDNYTSNVAFNPLSTSVANDGIQSNGEYGIGLLSLTTDSTKHYGTITPV